VAESRRAYRSPLRAEQAQRTRAAVLDAAGRCFLERGYAATTMKDVAAAAGVSLQTVFAQGAKSALLLACVDRALVGDDEEQPVIAREPFQRLMAATGKEPKLAALREIAVDRLPATGPVLRVFREAAATDPELAAAWADYEGRRHADALAVMGSFAPLLREDTSVARAADVLWAAFPEDTAGRFVDRGWTVEEYADWLVASLDRLLLR
jgi:AcrR family transcriptional regulator